MTSVIGVVDCGMGNLHSVLRAVQHAAPSATIRVCRQPQDIIDSERIVLPGQGAMPDAMRQLDESQMRDALLQALHNKPVLGICIGEQMLFAHSEEGNTPALGVLPGQVKRFAGSFFNGEQRLKIPQMGWNRVEQTKAHPLWKDIPNHSFFYFVHSYYVEPEQQEVVAGKTQHGLEFASVIAQDNIFAVQFHAEKSAQQGLQLLRNFVSWQP